MRSPMFLSIISNARFVDAFRGQSAMMVSFVVLGAGLGMMLVEHVAPGRPWPKVRGWWWRAFLLNAVQVGAVWMAGVMWTGWMYRHRPWSLAGLGTAGGALLGYFVLTFVYYWWHRWRHESDFLWRWFHQVHHSPQRLEVVTSFYKHPIEIAANSLLSCAVLYLMLGVSPAAASLAVLLSGIAELIYHWNVRTPCWLGYFFQRPESHCVHHQEGLHSYNYSDLPLWDMLFGTFDNPADWRFRCGFGAREHRLPEMIMGIDVNRSDYTQVPKEYAAAILLAVGLLQMAGSLSGVTWLRALGAAVGASPAPKVFCTVDGLETFSSVFVIEWTDHAGRRHARRLTPELYARLRGPYNRRNVYGAVLAYGPVFQRNRMTRKMYESVVRYSLCDGAPLLGEIGIDDIAPGSARVVLKPRPGTPFGDRPFMVTSACK